jgi:GNAT superfamily N-acetyltransferase
LTPTAVSKNLKDPTQHLYIVKVGELAIGILLLVLNAEPVPGIAPNNLYLSKIYLRNAYTGKGLGKRTLDFVHKKARAWGKETVWLCAMKKGPSLKFYTDNGYAIVGETAIRLPKVLEEEKAMWWMARSV